LDRELTVGERYEAEGRYEAGQRLRRTVAGRPAARASGGQDLGAGQRPCEGDGVDPRRSRAQRGGPSREICKVFGLVKVNEYCR
jgi:hypothetical protein